MKISTPYYPETLSNTIHLGNDWFDLNACRFGFNGQEKDDEVKGDGNSYAYEYRVHDSRLGRFLSIDPLSRKYPFYSPYQFCGNRLINAIEIEGLEPGVLFDTKDAAAENFGSFYNGESIELNREFGSTIYMVVGEDDVVWYAYSVAAISNSMESVIPSSAPNGQVAVATAHTHGGYMAIFDNNNFSGWRAENLQDVKYDPNAPTDIGASNATGLIAYLITPNGSLQKYNPRRGVIEFMGKNMPFDSDDPTRPVKIQEINGLPLRPLKLNSLLGAQKENTSGPSQIDATPANNDFDLPQLMQNDGKAN